ncbi:protein lin-37 homolog [Lineus longissimus]|uniref:protein lin-37 homolog n=1 Tax=Lineus longissimus TaxID=88925 RepID=UPI002B4F5DD3
MSLKNRNPQGTPEVHTARSKLDGVLQTLVERKDDSPVNSGDENVIQDILKDISPSVSPRKAAAKMSRKRKRKDDLSGSEFGQYHHTYVMKLFDRSVDLAQFEDNTPLYPICRAWMRNQPLNQNLAPQKPLEATQEPADINTDSDEDSDSPKDVCKLPDPIPIETDKIGGYKDPRIAKPIKQAAEHLNIHADQDTAPAPEQLLLSNMQHWKTVRQSWKEAGRVNEIRYKETTKLLRDMFDRQMKENN